MAKISNKNVYIPKVFLDLKDFFVITDSENFKRTKTVESKHVLNFINKYSGNPNSIFIYSNIQDEDFNLQTDGYFFSEANQENPELVSKLYFNFKNIFGEYITPLFQVIIESGVVAFKMINTDDSDNFVYIKPSEILVYEDYFEFDSEVISNLCSGNFINGNHYVVHFELYGGANSDQDNIKKEILIDCPAEITPTAFASIINALAAFSVSDKEIPTFKAVSTGAEPVTYYVELLNIGKGNYGVGQTQITAENIKITSFGVTADDIIELPSTQIIDIGTSASSIVDTINSQSPAITIQDQNDGYVIIKGTFEGVYHEYLWLGTGGIYGLDELQATAIDLKELNAVAPTIDKATPTYSGTVKTNIYSVDPVVYLKEEVDATEEVQNNRISDLEFPDIVLQNGTIDLTGLDLEADGYQWRLNQVEFLDPTPLGTTLIAATDNYFRYDLLQGDATGNYSIKQGVEDDTAADVPTVDSGKIALAVIAIEGDTIIAITPPDLTSIEARLTVLENYTPPPASGFTAKPIAIWSGVGLTYNYVFPSYYINNVLYPAISGQITLTDADPINPRFTSIIADVNGKNEVVGLAEENPVAPTLDPNTQLFVTNVLILAGATTPANVEQGLVYSENAGSPEWNNYTNDAGVNFNSSDAFDGTKAVAITNSTNNKVIEFTTPDPMRIVDIDGFSYWLKPIGNIPNNRGFNIEFLLDNVKVSEPIGIIRSSRPAETNNGMYNIKWNQNVYQYVFIPKTDFGFKNKSTFNKIRLTFVNSGFNARLDYIAIPSGNGNGGSSPDKKGFSTITTNNGTVSANSAEDIFEIIGAGGTVVSANGKRITIDSSSTDIIWHKFPWAYAGDISISGTTVTSSSGVFEADMVGAKIKVGDYDFIISSYSSATSVEVSSNPYGTVTAPNGSWGLYNKAVEVTAAGFLNLYGTSSSVPASLYSESTMILPNLVTTIGSLIGINANSFQLTSGVPITWRSGDLATDSTRDVGIRRNAAGVLEVFDGITAGEYRDMVVRNISGATATDPAHYVPLAQMEAADAAVLTAANSYADAGLATKLNAADYNDRYKGTFLTEAALNAAHPTASVGDSAQVNEVGSTVVVNYSWDDEDGVWVNNGTGGSGATNTDALPEGTSNLYFTTARVLATVLTGLSATAGTFTSSDSFLIAFNKIKYLIDNIATTYQTIAPNVQSVSSSATVTPVSTNDEVIITAQAVNLTLANPTGVFVEGQALIIRIKDNGTARTITFGSNYRAIGITLPTTTTISKLLYLAIIYNNTDSKWDIVGTRLEA